MKTDEKHKTAEEIKLNVAAVGMDLLNNSKPQIINKISNLQTVVSPKGLVSMPFDGV